MDYLDLTAPCGLDCWNCSLFLAQEDDELRAVIAQRTGRPLDECMCPGCRAQRGVIACQDMRQPCEVWRCTSKRGYLLCVECPEFPCAQLGPQVDVATGLPQDVKILNLCQIRKLGVIGWAEGKGLRLRPGSLKDEAKR